MDDNNKRFIELVNNVRRAQRKYFTYRTEDNLQASKDIETKLDRSLNWIHRHPGVILHHELINKAEQMLDAQRVYFKNRGRHNIERARALESFVDKILKKELDNQVSLF